MDHREIEDIRAIQDRRVRLGVRHLENQEQRDQQDIQGIQDPLLVMTSDRDLLEQQDIQDTPECRDLQVQMDCMDHKEIQGIQAIQGIPVQQVIKAFHSQVL
jgi:capsule polysaccharide export protein KpsE/RkpR